MLSASHVAGGTKRIDINVREVCKDRHGPSPFRSVPFRSVPFRSVPFRSLDVLHHSIALFLGVRHDALHATILDCRSLAQARNDRSCVHQITSRTVLLWPFFISSACIPISSTSRPPGRGSASVRAVIAQPSVPVLS